MPIAKAMDDCIVAYGMNGEAVRPQNGFPLRLMVPGFEGIFHTKWLRRIKLVDRYYMNYNDFGHLDQDHEGRGAGLPDRAEVGHHVPVRRTTAARQGLLRDQRPGLVRRRRHQAGGSLHRRRQEWNKAEFKGTPQRMAHARFGLSVELGRQRDRASMSRCTDEIGQVQPSREQIAKYWNKPFDQTFSVPGLDNSIQPWKIASDGSVTNGFA